MHPQIINHQPLPGSERNERCVALRSAEVLKLSGGIDAILAAREQDIDPNDVAVRIITREAVVTERTCINDLVTSCIAEEVVTECPKEISERCGSCILHVLSNGADVQKNMITKSTASFSL